MVVMSLIVTLATIGSCSIGRASSIPKEAVLKEDLFRMREAIDQYYADKNQYPATLEDLVSSGYLRAVPKDPFTGLASTWQTVPAEPDPNNPISVGGIFSVKSGSEGVAMDGSNYNDW